MGGISGALAQLFNRAKAWKDDSYSISPRAEALGYGCWSPGLWIFPFYRNNYLHLNTDVDRKVENVSPKAAIFPLKVLPHP